MARVEMEHPGLERRIEVDEVSVPHYRASGWRLVASGPETRRAEGKGRRRKKEES